MIRIGKQTKRVTVMYNQEDNEYIVPPQSMFKTSLHTADCMRDALDMVRAVHGEVAVRFITVG